LPKANLEISALTVRLIGEDGETIGIVSTKEALKIAESKGLDLVEVSPTGNPPVCKILDFGKYKYEAKKKIHDARKKQKVIEIKEIKLRPCIGNNDYEVKLRAIQKFIAEGDKVKITLKFKGREITHQEIGMNVLERLKNDTQEFAKLELAPKMEGKQILMVLAPNK
jgi:translation initiation factor IF-3